MPLDPIFSLAGALAMLGWLLLIFLPHWRGVARLVSGVLVPGLLAIAYAGLVMAWDSRAPGGFGSLDAVAALFGSRPMLLAGWIHYLAFDLLIGGFEVAEARRVGLPHWSIVPALGLTFMFGPAGYLLFQVQRAAWTASRGLAMSNRLPAWLAAAEPRLMAAAGVLLLALAPTLAAHLLDDRLLGGEPIWLKPMRFELALAVYLATLGVFHPLAGPGFARSRRGRFVVWAAIGTAYFEAIYIALQAGRGAASHFNYSSPTTSVMYSLMGVGAVTLAATSPLLAWGIARATPPGGWSAFRLSVVLGLVLTFVLGAVEGMYMAGTSGHLVGAAMEPAAQGLPLVGWSRAYGDLRVAHFLGIHAQQAIPLAGALAGLLGGRWGRRAVIGGAALYSAATIAALVMAISGQPLP